MGCKSIHRKHKLDDCSAFDLILNSDGVKCMNCGVQTSERVFTHEPEDDDYEVMRIRHNLWGIPFP
jgi:uncharacterized radical SAM superfamily Fe-S cluster-containing enzyme